MSSIVSKYSEEFLILVALDPFLGPHGVTATPDRSAVNHVHLDWLNPTINFWTHTWIFRREFGFCISPTDRTATRIFRGTEVFFVDNDVSLLPLTTYYYTAFGINENVMGSTVDSAETYLQGQGWNDFNTIEGWLPDNREIVSQAWGWDTDSQASIMVKKSYKFGSILYGSGE